MCFFDNLLINIIFLLFPIFVYLLYVCYNNNSKKNIQKYILDLTSFSSVYLLIRYSNYNKSIIVLLLVNIPLLISYIKKRNITAIFLTIIIIFFSCKVYHLSILFVFLEYLFYFIIFGLSANKNKNNDFFLMVFVFIKGIVLSFEIFYLIPNYNSLYILIIQIFILLIIFYFVANLDILLLEKGEQFLSLNNVLKQLEQEKKLRSSLFKITHEIKNPIAVCKGYLDMIDVNEKIKCEKYLNIIKQEIKRTLTLMDDFLMFTKVKLNKEEMDITMLLEDTIFTIEQLLNNNNIILKKDIPNEEIYIYGDYDKLKQVLINIIKNSIEAIEHNKGEIKICLKFNKNYIFIEIEDNGIGISKDNLLKINEAFFTTKSKGTGLGLSLSYEIIKLHDGKIDCISKEGKGTKMTITLQKK